MRRLIASLALSASIMIELASTPVVRLWLAVKMYRDPGLSYTWRHAWIKAGWQVRP